MMLQKTFRKEVSSEPYNPGNVAIKNFIFLPFDKRWELFVSLTILMNFMYNIFLLAYKFPQSGEVLAFYYTCELVFFITTCAIILHRSFRSIRRTRYHRKKPALLVALCLVTIIPIYEVYYMVSAFKWYHESSPWLETIILHSRAKACLRVIYALVYISQVRNQVGINDLFYVLCTHMFVGMCLTTVGTFAWHMSIVYFDTDTWANGLYYSYVNKSSAYEWMMIGYYAIVGFFTATTNGCIRGVYCYEKILVIIIMATGSMYQSVIFAGELLATFLRRQRHKFMFSSRLKKIMHLLDDWRVDVKVRKRTIDYYKVYWERRSGIGTMPSAFNLLPFSLRKEVTVDIFWDAFRHSKIFSETDTSFKRSISLHMKSELLLPGDYVYYAGEPKNKMVYILSGTIQIISEEDNDSPVLSLSGGTLLGEISCLAMYKSRVNVRCQTICEVQTLDIKAFYAVLVEFRNLTKELHSVVAKRIEYAKWATSDAVPKKDYTKESHVQLPILKKLKNQWQMLMRMNRSKKVSESAWQKLDKSFTSNYLDTLVICESQESDEHKICIKDTCPTVMQHDSGFRTFLENMVLVSIFMEVFLLPYDIFFNRKISFITQTLLLPVDLIYYLDIYLQLSTAIKISPEVTLTEPWDIVTYKFREFGFYVDLVAALPLNALFTLVGISERTAMVALCARMLKIKKLYAKFMKLEKQLFLHTLTINALKYFSLELIMSYFLSCILYATACYYKTCVVKSWYTVSKNITDFNDEKVFGKVFFFSLSLLLNYHVTDYLLVTIPEILMHIFIIFSSYALHTFMYAEITASACMSSKEVLEHQDETAMFKVIIKKRNVEPQLRSRLLHILEFHWIFNHGAEIFGKKGILAEASSQIRNDIINKRFINCLQCVPFFKDCPPTLLAKLAMAAEVVVLPQNVYVQNVDVMSHNVYVVLRGYCEMKSGLPGDIERNAKIILKRGDMLAVIETLHRVKMFSSITTVTAVELLSIPYESFLDSFQSYKTEYTFLQNALKEHMDHFETILMRKGCRLPEMRAPSAALGKVETFHYKVFMEKQQKSYVKDEHMKPFLKLGKWKWIRFFLLKGTIDPSGRPYKLYEIFRCVFIILEIFMLIFSLNLLNTQVVFVKIFVILGYIFGFIDQYLRMHCQYYNKKGILVTHPLYTLYNYLGTAFVTDLVSNLPLNFLGVRKMFRSSQYETELVIILVLRCLALYRPYKGLSYIQGRFAWSGATITLRVKLIIIIAIAVGFLSICLMSTVCEFTDDGEANCQNGAFRIRSLFQEQASSKEVFVQCIYIVATMYAQRTIAIFDLTDNKEIVTFIILVLITQAFRSVIMAIYTSTGIGGNVNLSNHQARMRQFLTFAKDVMLDENLTKEMVDHYEFVWRETLGTDINAIARKFNLYLRTQLVCFLYQETVRSTKIFGNAPDAIIQRFLPMLKEEHYKKGAEIIRCNDVQGNVFIVHRGIAIVSVADITVSVLNVGGLFGCFERSGMTRQTIKVTAKSHTTVLVVDSLKFNDIITEWDDKKAETMLKQIRLLNTEFMEPQVLTVHKIMTADKMSVQLFNYKPTCYDRMIILFNKYVNDESKWYQIYDCMINVHISTFSTIGILAYAFIDAHKPPHWSFYLILYLLDFIFASKFLFGFHLAIADLVTGFKLTNAKLIARKYIKKDFLIDVASWLPFEIIGMYLLPNWVKMFTLNRVLRMWYLQKYYDVRRNKLTVSKHLRWSYLVYTTLFKIQLMISSWFVVACLQPSCYAALNVTGRPVGVVATNDTTISTLLGYTYVINLFTRGGLRDSLPVTTIQLIATIAIALYSHIIVAQLTGSYANIIMIQNNMMDKYNYKISRIKHYLQGRQLSPAIFRKVWEYFLQLWTLQQGEWMPYLITFAPPYLKQDVMYFLYGYHLQNHFLFSKTHKDFLRQVVALLERRTYLPENVIVEQGDVEQTMYFLHAGEVGAYDKHGNNEILCFILRSEMSFGEAQGMYGIPFKVCYRALTVTTVLALQKSAWEYLLKWFPASNEEIMAKAQEYGLKTGFSYYHDQMT